MNVFLLTMVVLLVFMTTMFVLALRRADNSLVDIAYGPAFVLVGWSAWIAFGDNHPRQLLLLGLVTVWGLRLAAHILLRKRRETGEDFRYRQWREAWGTSFVWRSYLQIFLLQGAVIFVVALPVLLVMESPGGRLGLLDLAGSLLWLLGFGFEAVGDWQLLQFKKVAANRGRILQSGLWRYTRHPNYFGEATLWWGLFLIACSAPYGAVAILSPLLIDGLLLKVSGIPMLEAKYADNPEFKTYQRRTSAFFPWPPRQETDRDSPQ